MSDAPVSVPPSSTAKPPRRRRRLPILLALLSLAALAGVGGLYWQLYLRGVVSTDDARIDAHLVDVAPEVGGTLTALAAHEGDHVQAGAVLFELDTTTLRAAQERARADVSAAEAQLAMAEAGNAKALHGPRAAEIRIALADRERARAQASLAETEWERTNRLHEQSVVPDAERLRAQTARDTAQQEVAQAEDRLKLLRSGTRVEDLASAKAQVEAARANLSAAIAAVEQAKVNIERCTVKAPFAGIVAREWRQPGATVAPGTPVLTLLDPATVHVAANIDERDLGQVSLGDPVAICVDAFPDVVLHGHVATILRATNSQFGLVPAEGVSGTFIKVTQRVPLRITLDSPPPSLELSPGLSVEVRIRVASAPESHTVVSSRD